jgi:aminopeptidase N
VSSATTSTPDPVDGVAAWRIDHLTMRLELDAERTIVECESDVVRIGDGDAPLVLDGRGLETLRVAVDGRELVPGDDDLTDRTLTIALGPGERHRVATTVAVRPAGSTDLGVVVGPQLISTRVEPQGFRRITWSIDRPSNRATYDVTLVADPVHYPTLLANGSLVDQGTLSDGRAYARYVDSVAKPSYLFAAVAGELAIRSRPFTTRTGRILELRVAAPPELIGGAEFALETMAATIAYDEANGGLEHDHDTLTFVAVPGYPDATEYQGLMFFDPALLVVDTRGWVDDDLVLILLNIAHEYGHHTRGNRVTVRSWGQLALKEGLTVLTAQNDVRRHLLGPAGRVLEVLDLRRLQFPEEVTLGAPVVRGEVDNPEQLYTRTTYLKGAEVFGMLRSVLGPDRWHTVFTTFHHRFDLDAAGIDDFLGVAHEVAPDRTDAIDGVARWFALTGRPALSCTVADDGSTITVARTDSLRDEPPVGVPMRFGFRSLDGSALAVSLDGGPPAVEHLVLLDGRERTVRVEAPTPFALAPLRGYTAPVDLAVDHDRHTLAALVVHDDDAYTRWWAAEALMIRAIDAHRAGRTDDAAADVSTVAAALGTVLAAGTDRAPGAEPMLLAQLLAVPDEFMLGDREPQIDVDGVASGLGFLRRELGLALHDPLVALLDRHADPAPHGTAPADLARRALVEPVLALLLASGSDESLRVALGQLDAPDHTRAVRALGQLLHVDRVDADELVARTYDRWEHAPKLLDRWLRAQSGARRADTIERVAALASGPLYDRDDRGRVMGVWFPFATRNRSVFHHPSGDGYRVFVDEVIELMPVNAGLVIRLVGDLLQFRRFDDHRQALLRSELGRLADAPGMPGFAVDIVRGLLA